MARKLADIAIVACAHGSDLQRMGTPRTPADLLQHWLVGYDRDDTDFLAEAIPRALAV